MPTEANPMPFIHQSTLVKNELLKKHPFDQKYKVLADHNFFYTLYKEKCSYVYVPITISSYNAQFGLSAENPYRQHIEYAFIHGLNKKKKWPFIKFYYIVRYGLHMRLRRLLPDQLADMLILLKKKHDFER